MYFFFFFFFFSLLINPFLSDVRLTSWACASSVFLPSVFEHDKSRVAWFRIHLFQLPLVNIKKSLAPIFLWRLSFSIFFSHAALSSLPVSFSLSIVADSHSARFSFIIPWTPSLFPCSWFKEPGETEREWIRHKKEAKTRDWAPSTNRDGLRSAVLKLELIDIGLSNSLWIIFFFQSSYLLNSASSKQSEDHDESYARLGEFIVPKSNTRNCILKICRF